LVACELHLDLDLILAAEEFGLSFFLLGR